MEKAPALNFSGYAHTPENARLLLNAILYASGESLAQKYVPDNLYTECAYYPQSKTLVLINNSDKEQAATVQTDSAPVTLTPYGTEIIAL